MKPPSLAGTLMGMSLSGRIVLGLVLGVLAGLFFGEPAAALQPIADVYIRLMQMTVLPYLVAALIVGFGQLDPLELRKLARRGGAMLLATWVLTFAVIALMPMTFPKMQSAAFFSSAIVEPSAEFFIADLYFSANPFSSLANSVVPAVVLFSSMMGLGLIGNPQGERVLGVLRVLSEAVVEITRFVVGLTPVGVFAIVAVTVRHSQSVLLRGSPGEPRASRNHPGAAPSLPDSLVLQMLGKHGGEEEGASRGEADAHGGEGLTLIHGHPNR